VLNSAQAHPQISNEVYMLNSSLTDLQNRSTLSQVQADVTELDSALSHMLGLLESARQKGYVYQKDIDDVAYQIMDQWQPIRENVLRTIPQQASSLQNSMLPLSNQVNRLNSFLGNPTAAQPLLTNTYSQVNTLLGSVNEVEGSLRNSYSQIESQESMLTTRLNSIHWALNQLDESKVKLANGENLVTAVQARWDQEGEEDPEGLLYLTNKRLVFERKEKIATKKVLFITISKELVQEVMIDQALANIQSVKAVNKGVFGNQDFIEVQFADKKLGQIPFHLNGQDSTQCKFY
jgi:chromosome segregation ATPase